MASKSPFVLEDTSRVQLTASEDDQQAHFQSFDKIQEGSNISLDNVAVNLDFGKGHSISRIELVSKRVLTEVGSGKEKELKNFELRLSVGKINGEFPLAITTYDCLRRMERQELLKKHYKPSKVDVLAFFPASRRSKRPEPSGNPEAEALDTESIGLLRGLLPFVDKEELFRVLLKKPLRDRQSKKLVRMCIIPTDAEEGAQDFSTKKKGFNYDTILELLSDYEAREERTRS